MKDLHIPFYLRLRDKLAGDIERSVLQHHVKLPSERELSKAYDLNRVTVRQALMQLESEGLIYRLIRRGWYVSPPRLFYDPSKNISFMDNVRAQGHVPETIILSKSELAASVWTNRTMGIELGAPVHLLRRCRMIDRRAVLVEHIHVNATLCPGLLELPLDCSLTALLREHYGIRISRTRVNMYPAPLNGDQAAELNVVAGAPGLFLTRTSYDQNNQVVEFDQEFWRHDIIEIALEVVNNAVDSE